MLKSNLIEAFKTFTPKEMKEFGEFVNSPYFNKNKNVKKLYDIIKKYYPSLDSDKLDKEKVFEKIYSDEKYKDSTMRLLMFYLYEVVEKFFAHNRVANNEVVFKEYVVKELLGRDLYKDFEKTIKQVLQKLDEGNTQDVDYYMDKFTFEHEYLTYLCTVQNEQYDKFMNKESIEKVFNNLTYYYLIRVFKFYSVVLTTQTLYNTNVETHLFENIMNSYDAELFKYVPMINIYYNAVMCLLKPEEEKYYFSLKKLVIENTNNIKEDLADLYINLENYCTRKTRAGNPDFYKENLEILKREIDLGLYRANGYMSPSFYKSTVVVGMEQKEYNWVKKFIEKYRFELDKKNMYAVYNYCHAYVAESEGKYESGLEYLAKVKTDELYLKIDIKVLQCKLFFMLNWQLPLSSLLETFKRTLTNNKMIPEKRKILYLKFIKYLNKLNNLKDNPDENRIIDAREEIIKDDFFAQKNWIVKRVNELFNVLV